MVKLLTIFFILLAVFFKTPFCFAESNNFVSIVNPVRGSDSLDTVIGEEQILKQFNLNATWLLRFDALENQNILSAINERSEDEKGLFLEVTTSLAKQSEVSYHVSESWHEAGSAFLTGYEIGEREKLIDAAFEKFKNTFGYFPKSVGAWWIDSYSLGYMQKKYAISSAMIVSDQYSTDNYQIWGQYFSTPYYPSKNNALHPAQTLENKLPIVITQWATRDPVNAYGNGVSESTYSVQANDYEDFHNLDINYFSKLLDIYTNQPFNKFSHVTIGLENSYPFEKYKSEYKNQMSFLSEKRNSGKISIITLENFSNWYKSSFPNLSPEHLIIADDPLGSFKKVVWFMNPYFRAGWFYDNNGSTFRDIRQYVDGEEEICFRKRCDSVNFATSATRVLDDVSFGHKWIIDQGKIKDFKVSHDGDKYTISYLNEAGKIREIDFLPRDIGIDGKVSSIDTIILNATAKQAGLQKENIERGNFTWSLNSVLSKIIKFGFFLVFACLIPGLVLTKKVNLFLSTVVGIVLLTFIFYVASLIKFTFLVYLYLLVSFILFIRLGIFSQLRFPFQNLKERSKLLSAVVIFIGTIFQSMPTFRSGLTYPYGIGFWGPNTHDGIWHISLINQLIKGVPPENPIFSGTILKNYHFFYNLLIAVTNYISGIPVSDLVFRFYPILFSLLLGLGTYYLVFNLFKQKSAAIFSLYFVYFAGSFGWVVEYLRLKHLGGESAFWANQSISFNLNPPFAISLIIIIAIFNLLNYKKMQKNIMLILIILAGTLISFKSYAAILILATLFIVSIIKKSLQMLIIFIFSTIFSIILFVSNFSLSTKLILFSPFWFIHSMVDSPDRVGWIRLSLARTAGLLQHNWFKFITAEIIGLILFIAGNLGTRILALFSLSNIKKIWQKDEFFSIFIFSFVALIIPILFIQAGNPWNTIQFIYYSLYFAALVSGIVILEIVKKFKSRLVKLFILLILILTPINSWATANGYLSYQPHAKISNKEVEALKFLASQKDGIVLTYPYDDKLKSRLAEPWPILAYDSTAYVSALAKKETFLEDESQNQILLTDYKRRLVASKDFFKSEGPERNEFLRINNISYIYLPKIYNESLDSGKISVNLIFENDEVLIYQFNKI